MLPLKINPPWEEIGRTNAVVTGTPTEYLVDNYRSPLSLKSVLHGLCGSVTSIDFPDYTQPKHGRVAELLAALSKPLNANNPDLETEFDDNKDWLYEIARAKTNNPP